MATMKVVALPSLRAYLDGPQRFLFPKGDVGVCLTLSQVPV